MFKKRKITIEIIKGFFQVIDCPDDIEVEVIDHDLDEHWVIDKDGLVNSEQF